jgi:hypothetical protein
VNGIQRTLQHELAKSTDRSIGMLQAGVHRLKSLHAQQRLQKIFSAMITI